MSNSDLRYAALVCALMLAVAAITRLVALLPGEKVEAVLEIAAFAPLAICAAAVGLLSRRGRTPSPRNFMDPYQ